MTASQLEPVRVHPRRRPASKRSLPALGTDETVSASSKMPLKKGETFNTPTTPSSDRDPVMNIHALPRRSPTSLEAIAASEQRMTSILERLTLNPPEDQQYNFSLPKSDSFSPNADRLNDDDDFRNASSSETDEDDQDRPAFRKSRVIHSHGSDSGLGSSVSSVAESAFGEEDKVNEDAQLEESAIKTHPIFELTSPGRRQLHFGACKQIERYILAPLLKEPKFKPFHALVESVPKRIVKKQIVCLRDLEKTLLWIKPISSISRHAYLQFSEFTIQSLHTSVSHLSVRDQRLPTDRPYTNGYFLDLVSQVRRYAAMMQASRERVDARSENQGKDDKDKELMPPPSLTVVGGLSKNGRPVELVVTEGSNTTSMATGQLYDPESPPVFKRTLSDEADEGVERSMARRKKNAPPMDINQKCDHCDKVFKRPCDLTKHEKTHSRPWKCTEPTCKYSQVGWPTEKERDRHVNDKHSDTPNLFKCQFQPCTYASKRESNCKQHMEKAHGWLYVRSKKNARGGSKSGASVQATPSTPSVASTPSSNPVDASTPASGSSPSPSGAALFSNLNFNFNDPVPVRNDDCPPLFETSPYAPSSTGMTNNVSTFSSSINFDAFQAQLEAGDPNGLIPALEMHRQSMNSMSVPSANSVPDLMGASMSFDGSPAPPTDNQSFNFDFEWSHLDMPAAQDDYTAMNMPFATSGHSQGNMGLSGYSGNHGVDATSNLMNYGATGKLSGLSPNAQGNLMLYSPGPGATGDNLSNQYEYPTQANAGNDFTLYDQFNRMGTPGMSLAPMSQAPTGSLAHANQMFPALNERDSMFQSPQAWTEQSIQGANSENGFPQEMDSDLMNMK